VDPLQQVSLFYEAGHFTTRELGKYHSDSVALGRIAAFDFAQKTQKTPLFTTCSRLRQLFDYGPRAGANAESK